MSVSFWAQRIIDYITDLVVALVAQQTMALLDDAPVDQDFCSRRDWQEDGTLCSDGSWDPGTHGSGEASGHYGLSTYNWGGSWIEPDHQHHFNELLRSPCHIMCLQAASERLNIGLQDCACVDMLIIRAPEPRDTLMVCARRSKVQGLRLEVFHRLYDGAYPQELPHAMTRRLHAESRIMVCTAKMKDARLRGGGAHSFEDGYTDEIRIVNVHLHIETSKGMLGYNKFWDELAKYCVIYRPRFLCGDFGTALFNVAPEMRTRGFQINLAAWQCWRDCNCEDEGVMLEDIGIFRIGPCDGIHMCYNSSVFGFSAPAGSFDFSYLWEEENESESEHLILKYHEVQPFSLLFNARHFKECVRAYPSRREQFMINTFTPVFGVQSRAMAEMQALGSNKEMFPHGVSTSMGDFSWCLAHDLASEQRVGRFGTSYYALGSSVPVMIFMGKEDPEKRGQKRRHNGVYM